jgi:hypothetical protein
VNQSPHSRRDERTLLLLALQAQVQVLLELMPAIKQEVLAARAARQKTDDALEIVDDLAEPIEAALRAPYRTAVALALARYKPEQVTPRLVARVARELRREFL